MSLDNKSILLFGSTGLLGSDLYNFFSREKLKVLNCDRSIFDFSKPNEKCASDLFIKNGGGVAVICAAISDVEKCYQDPIQSNQVNVVGMIQLLKLLTEFQIFPVFFSSDYVFSGEIGRYKETDTPSPTTVYGRQKLEVEKFIQSSLKDYLIIRTSKIFSYSNHGRNHLSFLVNELKLRRNVNLFFDQIVTPVMTEDVFRVLCLLLENNSKGIYHFASSCELSRVEIGNIVAKKLNLDRNLIIEASLTEQSFSEKRPFLCTLSNEKIRSELNFDFQEMATLDFSRFT